MDSGLFLLGTKDWPSGTGPANRILQGLEGPPKPRVFIWFSDDRMVWEVEHLLPPRHRTGWKSSHLASTRDDLKGEKNNRQRDNP